MRHRHSKEQRLTNQELVIWTAASRFLPASSNLKSASSVFNQIRANRRGDNRTLLQHFKHIFSPKLVSKSVVFSFIEDCKTVDSILNFDNPAYFECDIVSAFLCFKLVTLADVQIGEQCRRWGNLPMYGAGRVYLLGLVVWRHNTCTIRADVSTLLEERNGSTNLSSFTRLLT